MRQPQTIVDDTIKLWDSLASEIISIIGEVGFQSLYHRSIYLSSAEYPWLAAATNLTPDGSRFGSLRSALQAQDGDQAVAASIALLGTFFDIVIRLIGERLTTNILRAAWGDEAVNPAI